MLSRKGQVLHRHAMVVEKRDGNLVRPGVYRGQWYAMLVGDSTRVLAVGPLGRVIYAVNWGMCGEIVPSGRE